MSPPDEGVPRTVSEKCLKPRVSSEDVVTSFWPCFVVDEATELEKLRNELKKPQPLTVASVNVAVWDSLRSSQTPKKISSDLRQKRPWSNSFPSWIEQRIVPLPHPHATELPMASKGRQRYTPTRFSHNVNEYRLTKTREERDKVLLRRKQQKLSRVLFPKSAKKKTTKRRPTKRKRGPPKSTIPIDLSVGLLAKDQVLLPMGVRSHAPRKQTRIGKDYQADILPVETQQEQPHASSSSSSQRLAGDVCWDPERAVMARTLSMGECRAVRL